jgi:UDP-N-acetylmuramate dehydrogenase
MPEHLFRVFPHLQQGVALAPFTTYKIGGPADYFLEVTNADELAEAVKLARKQEIPYFVLGLGANILVSDKGFRGLVILNRAKGMRFDGQNVSAESGVVVADLISACQEKGLSGLEHFAGIPSTVGGAMWQNLHFLSPDRERTVFIEEVTLSAKVLDEKGEVLDVDREFFKFGYDESVLRDNPELILLEATFSLTTEDPALIAERKNANLEWRAARHPNLQAFPSCGSVFKKIEGVGAGRLIEQVGLKGHVIGGIQSSEKHANFLVNIGGAKAADVLAMIDLIQTKVKEQTGYVLEPEIHFLGEK